MTRRRDRRSASKSLPQLPFAQVANPYAPPRILSDDQIEVIHHASLKILAEIGMEVMQPECRSLLKEEGAEVDEATLRVRFDPALIEALAAKAPASFRMRARNPAHDITIGGALCCFAATGGPAFGSDLAGGRRAGHSTDMRDYIKLVHMLNVIHQEGGCPIEPTDLPADTRHLDFYEAALTLTDKTWQCWALGGHRVEDALSMIGIAYGLTREEMRAEPVTLTVVNSNSPLRLDIPMGEALLTMARAGQPVAMTPFTLAGAMSPVTLAGALAQQNAEALAMIALAQAAAPGAPVLYGGFTSNVDMKTGAPAFGTPEYTKAAFASGQLARRYNVPFRSSNVTASNAVDAQAAYESGMSLWGAILGGAHLIEHAAGWLEGGLTASFEKLILDAEMLQLMRETLQPIDTSDAALGLDAIAEAGPGGHFFGTAHTIERFEHAFYTPMLSDWRNFENWRDTGGKTATERAHTIWKGLLADYEEPALDPARKEALAGYVRDRKKALGA